MNRPDHDFAPAPISDVREDWLPKDAYFSPEFAELERQRLWPKVWQPACRLEELPQTGSYITYDILDCSIIVVRTGENEIRAYNNACLHRGRRLTEGCGQGGTFRCRYHGWAWNLRGQNVNVTDREDWGDRLDPATLNLPQFHTGTWGGWVFVNMDPDAEPLMDYLSPVPDHIGWMEFEKQRCRWHVSVEVEANWKTAQEAFEEAYHVAATHPRYAPDFDYRAVSMERGRHGQLNFRPFDQQSPGINAGGMRGDPREAVVSFIRGQARDLTSIYTDRDLQAASRILTDLPADASYGEAATLAAQYIREAAIASGVGYPDVTPEQMANAGFDWTIFPNLVNVIPSPTCGFWYRTRPTRDNNPNRCVVEMYALERFAPGTEPVVEHRYFTDWRDWTDMPIFLEDDFINIPEVQRGMKTPGFQGSRINPVQERPLYNFHRVLRNYVYGV